MTSPPAARELLLRFRFQANGKLTLFAPNGDAHVIEADDDAPARIGATVLAVFSDDTQPAATVEPDGRASSAEPARAADPSAPADKPEDAFRGFLNAIFPGGERALDLLQDLSS